MNFTSQICTTKEQSERLISLGLKKETADCFWLFNTSSITGKTHCRIIVGEFEEDNRCVPAWSLHRLIELLGLSKICLNIDLYDSPYEEIIRRIDIFIHTGVFNRKYLKE